MKYLAHMFQVPTSVHYQYHLLAFLRWIAIFGFAVGITSCAGTESEEYSFLIEISDDYPTESSLISLPLSQITADRPTTCSWSVLIGETEVPSQCEDLDAQEGFDHISWIVDAEKIRQLESDLLIQIRNQHPKDFPSHTQVFLKAGPLEGFDQENSKPADRVKHTNIEVPEFAIHESGWAHMEGPVWESDRIGYRTYLDSRNRIDIFGKQTTSLVLDTISTDYHAVQDWGADILKVGSSLGIGSLAAYMDGQVQVVDNWNRRFFEVLAEGPVRSIFRLTWQGWEVFGRTLDVQIDYEIHANHLFTDQTITISGDTEGLQFATGIVRHAGTEFTLNELPDEGIIIQTHGDQSDQGHSLSMGLLVSQEFSPQYIDSDPFTHLVLLTPVNGSLRYRYAADWNLQGVDSQLFEAYMEDIYEMMVSPLTLKTAS